MTAQAKPRQQSRARLSAPLPAINWAWFALALAFIGYWLFVSSLERVEGSVILARFFLPDLTPSQAATVPFPVWATTLVELFHPRVLRHFIPVFAGWWLAVQAAISLMQVLYNCPDRRTAAEFLRRQRRNRVKDTDVPYLARPENLEGDRERSILLQVGGPVRVQIPGGHAAVTERNARFLRVIPPGVHDLGRFEYLVEVIDLHPQERTIKDVSMLTREGIPLKADVSLTFRIDPGDNPVTHQRPFPYSQDAVKRAAYSGSAGPGGKVGSWADGPVGRVAGALGGMVANDSLDNLIAAPSPRDAHHLLTEAVMSRVWDGLPKDGIKPIRMRIGRLTPPPEVSAQYTEFWLANQRKEDMLARATGTAQLVHEAETARAAAEIAMIQAIVEGVRNAQQEAGTKLSGYLLAVRLLEALRQMFQFSTQSVQSTGGDTLQLLSEIDSVEDDLTDLQERLSMPIVNFRPSKND